MTARAFLARLATDRDGSMAVEFALLGPVVFGLFLGVFQIGVGMHGYNALRGISSDVARNAVINYQSDNDLTNSQLADYATNVAVSAPYMLTADDVEISIGNAATQRVTGAKELTFTIEYQVPSFLTVIGIDSFPISYSRPIFVIA